MQLLPRNRLLAAFLIFPTNISLLERDRKNVLGWKAANLSEAGQATLIQCNLKELPSHTIQCFKLPVYTSIKLDQIIAIFSGKISIIRDYP